LKPLPWIRSNVAADFAQAVFAADDVFIVVALPEWFAGGVAKRVDTFCGYGFEGTD
jgi:hypothetical protein